MALALGFAMRDSASLARAGYEGDPITQADKLFDAIIAGHSGVVSRATICRPPGSVLVARVAFS